MVVWPLRFRVQGRYGCIHSIAVRSRTPSVPISFHRSVGVPTPFWVDWFNLTDAEFVFQSFAISLVGDRPRLAVKTPVEIIFERAVMINCTTQLGEWTLDAPSHRKGAQRFRTPEARKPPVIPRPVLDTS
jgi:hypothetical protein